MWIANQVSILNTFSNPIEGHNMVNNITYTPENTPAKSLLDLIGRNIILVTPSVYAIYFATIDFPNKKPHDTFIYANYYLKCVYVKKIVEFFLSSQQSRYPPVYIYLFKMLYFLLQQRKAIVL